MDYDKLIKQKWKPRPNRRPCCNDKDNMQYAFELNNQKDKVILKCRKCGSVHHYSRQDPGRIASRLSGAGGA